MSKKTTIFVLSGIALAVAIFGAILFLRSVQVENASAVANRLRLIDGAKNQWALMHDKHTNDVPTWSDILGYIYHPSETFPGFSFTNGILVNSNGEAYTIGRVDELSVCNKYGKSLKY